MPQLAANTYPQRAPWASMMNPTTDDPAATPTAIPVLSQVIASVLRPGRAWAWARL